MLAVRVIPTLLVRGASIVKGKRFAADRPIGFLLPAVRVFDARQVDELVILDVSARAEGRTIRPELVASLDFHGPLAVGGGVRSVDDARALLLAGADKIVLGSAQAASIPDLARALGSQSVVVTLDHREGEIPVDAARALERAGAGEIILQAMDRDGMMCGYDLAALRAVVAAVGIPVVASGGAGSYADMAEALYAGAHAVAAGAMWQFTDATPAGARAYLRERGWPTRV